MAGPWQNENRQDLWKRGLQAQRLVRFLITASGWYVRAISLPRASRAFELVLGGSPSLESAPSNRPFAPIQCRRDFSKDRYVWLATAENQFLPFTRRIAAMHFLNPDLWRHSQNFKVGSATNRRRSSWGP